MLQCRLGVETFVGVQTAGCIRWGALQEWDKTHTHISLTGTAPHYLLLDTGPHTAQQRSTPDTVGRGKDTGPHTVQQRSTPDTVGRGKGSMDSANTTASLAR